MFCAENLSQLNRGRVVLDAIEIHVAPCEIVALVGPEAAWKTAVLECFLGLRSLSGGRVAVAGFDIVRHAQEAVSHLAYIPACVALPQTRSGLLATRDLVFARRIATRVVLLERGAVVETFDPNASRRAFHAYSYLAELVA